MFDEVYDKDSEYNRDYAEQILHSFITITRNLFRSNNQFIFECLELAK